MSFNICPVLQEYGGGASLNDGFGLGGHIPLLEESPVGVVYSTLELLNTSTSHACDGQIS